MQQESHERFRGCFEQAPFGICMSGPDGRLIQVNAAFCRMLGYSEQELLNTSWADLIHPGDLALAQERKEELWTGGSGFVDAETRFVHHTGRLVLSRIRVSLVRDGCGEPAYSILHVDDITESRRTENALRESEDRFHIMADGCPAPMWVTNAKGGNEFVNRAYREFAGTTCEQVKGPRWQPLLHPEDAPAYLAVCHRAIQEHTSFRAETRLRRADGEWRWLETSAAPRLSESGEFLGHVGLSSDITERREAEQIIRNSQDLAQSTIDALSSHVCVLNELGTIIAVNRAWKDFARANPKASLTERQPLSPDADCFGEGVNYLAACDHATGPCAVEASKFAAAIRAALEGDSNQFSLEYPCHSSTEQRWFIGRVTRFSINKLPRILVVHTNITDLKLADQVIESSEEKFRQLAENIHEVFWMMNAAATEMIYVSPAYEHIWGQTSASLYANPESWMHSIHPEDRARATEIFLRQLQGEIVESEYRIVQPSGAIRWIRDQAFPVRDKSGKIIRLAGVAEDNTERKLAELRLIHDALYDELTGLPNRRLFREKLGKAIENGVAGQSGAVFFMDLDRFKLINDTLGHAAGDRLLKEVAGRMLAVCGRSGTLARFGGDEFTLVDTGFEGRDAVAALGEALIRCLDEPFQVADREVFIGASVGVSLFPKDGTAVDALKTGADMAMHEAKRAGKNQLKFFTPDLSEAARERLEMETRIRKAVALSEFKLQFQPEFASGRSRPSRFEALIRWHPADGQPISPLKFIPVAEQNGLIVPIGTWVLHEACRQCADWQNGQLKDAGVAVNVSALQFASPDFVDVVARALDVTKLPARLLELEVTESVFIQDVKRSALILTRLRNLGVTIALDDFGTGYSSLSYLQNLPLDAMKIDRSFLTESEGRPERAAVLRCIVDLAHTLGLRVVGEGVETTAQLDLLRSLGCDEIQGFLLGRPSFDAAVGDARSCKSNAPLAA